MRVRTLNDLPATCLVQKYGAATFAGIGAREQNACGRPAVGELEDGTAACDEHLHQAVLEDDAAEIPDPDTFVDPGDL